MLGALVLPLPLVANPRHLWALLEGLVASCTPKTVQKQEKKITEPGTKITELGTKHLFKGTCKA